MSAVATVDSAYALTAASYAIILTRILLRRLKHERFLSDDYLMLFAMVFYALNTAAWPITNYSGTSLTVKDPKSLAPEQLERVVIGSKWLLISRAFYISYLWTLKSCTLIYYTRLTVQSNDLLAVKMAFGLLAVTWIICFSTFLLECRPIWLYWQVLPTAPQCAKAIASVIIFGTTNIVTDLVIMAIPLPLIFRAKFPFKTRVKILALFCLWVFVITVSIIKMTIVLEHPNERRKMIWTQIECFSATIVANAPVIHGLWRHGYLHIRKGNFGIDVCTPTPEYNLNVRAATEGVAPQIQGELRASRGSLGTRVSGGIRNSIRKITEKIRSSFDDNYIEQSISILQETRTGRLESSEAGEIDMFMGPTRSFGHVSTEISCGVPPIRKPKHAWSRFMLHSHHEPR